MRLLLLVFMLTIVELVVDVPSSFAQEAAPIDEARETEIAQRSKKRLYPGGRDEEDLRVQAELVTPTRKVAPQTEVKEETDDDSF